MNVWVWGESQVCGFAQNITRDSVHDVTVVTKVHLCELA